MYFKGVKESEDDFVYLLKFKDHKLPTKVITSEKAIKTYPKLVMEFLESKMVWKKQVRFRDEQGTSKSNTPQGTSENNALQGTSKNNAPQDAPITVTCKIYHQYRKNIIRFQHSHFRISDASDINKEIEYWMEWPDNHAEFVRSSAVKENWPDLAIKFLQNNLHFEE